MIPPERAYELIQNSNEISDKMRLDIFEFLAQYYSLIPLRGGFPAPGESANAYKAPIEAGWQRWCSEKRPFNRADFKPERAGITCGPASGALVLDIDSLGGFQNWCANEGLPKEFPRTLVIRTGGKGERYHLYFNYPTDGVKYGNRAMQGIFDVRGDGGYVICPGSIHPETRRPYTIHDNSPVADAPEWLLEFVRTRRTPSQVKASKGPLTGFQGLETAQQEQTMNQQQPPMDISSLPVSDEIKNLIQTATPKGKRSEASMKVLLGLLGAGVLLQTVQEVYQHYPIGEKARENQPGWLDREIQKAQEYIAQVKPQGTTPANPFDASLVEAPKVTYRAMSALEVATAQVDFSFLIENFWPKFEPMLITGHGGAGKSLLTLQVAMDLVHPQPPLFLDSFKVNGQHKILFVQSENSILGIKRRLQIIRSGHAIPDDVLSNRMVFLGIGNDIRATGDMMRSGFRDVIKEHIQRYETDILVLDPLISFHALNENSNDEMRRLLDSVSMFCEENSVTPLLIHHHGKNTSESGSGGGRGASAIGDWSANTWELYIPTSKSFKLKHMKARNFALQDELHLELVNLRFRKTTATAKQSNVQYVIQALSNLNGIANSKADLAKEIQQIAKNAQGNPVSEGTARNYIDEAVKSGIVDETPVQGARNKQYSLK